MTSVDAAIADLERRIDLLDAERVGLAAALDVLRRVRHPQAVGDVDVVLETAPGVASAVTTRITTTALGPAPAKPRPVPVLAKGKAQVKAAHQAFKASKEGAPPDPLSGDAIRAEIVRLLTERPTLSAAAVAREMKMSGPAVLYHMAHLKRMALVRREGTSRNARWVVLLPSAPARGGSGSRAKS